MDAIFISFTNPYYLRDIPRIKTYINAFTANKETVKATLDKFLVKGSLRE